MRKYAAPPATSEIPGWRLFTTLPFAEAAFVAARAGCDPSTMRVMCRPGTTSFAVAGQDSVQGWHWAVFSAGGMKLDDGWERTIEDAQRVAVEARQLWMHRCQANSGCRCADRA